MFIDAWPRCLHATLGRKDDSARERATYAQQRLEELRQRAADPAR